MPNKRSPGPRRAVLTFAGLLLLAAVGLVWLSRSGESAEAGAAGQAASGSQASGPGGAWPFHAGSNKTDAERARDARIAQATARLAQARQTLESYRQSTRYPPDTRPMDEQRDQTYPNQPVAEDGPLATEDGKVDPVVHIKTSQSRVFVASGEQVQYTVAAVDDKGKPLPLTITRAIARGITAQGSSLGTPQAMPLFNDNGTDGDAAANDGTYTATLSPATTAFAQFNGTIRLEVALKVGEHDGIHRFDIIYTPELPAVWSGPVREVLARGSLSLYLPANVKVAGRYIVTGRLDDAAGKPFALLTFNEELGTGPQAIRLEAFGKLILDRKPALPLRLRDVDGYLLKENGFPDRALMPRLMGLVFTTKVYPLSSFSDAEWTSEERDRYLAEYGNDVTAAQQALDQAQKGP